MIPFWVLLGLVVLRWGLILFGAALIIKPVSACPACFQPTLLLRSTVLRRLAPGLEQRWCPACGWRGLARRTSRPLELPTLQNHRRPESSSEAEAA